MRSEIQTAFRADSAGTVVALRLAVNIRDETNQEPAMHAIAIDTSNAFQVIDHDQLALVGGAFSFGEAVNAGNAAAPMGAEAGKNLGPLVGTVGGGVGGFLAGGPGGALAGAGAGYAAGTQYGEGIGRGLGFLGGFGGNVYDQLTR
jgi:hypothetical protein